MPRSVPYRRSSQTMPARLGKKRLLPISKDAADSLALQAHLSLAAVRTGVSEIGPANNLTEIILLAHFLSEAGHGELRHELLLAANSAMAGIYDEGNKRIKWIVTSEEAFAVLARIVCLYDQQLRTATLGALESACDRLTRFRAGEINAPALQERGK